MPKKVTPKELLEKVWAEDCPHSTVIVSGKTWQCGLFHIQHRLATKPCSRLDWETCQLR